MIAGPVGMAQALPPPPNERHPPHIVMADFRFMLGLVTGEFKRGQDIVDHSTIERLLAAGMPIAPADQVDDMVCCPRCAKTFSAKQNRPQGKGARAA